MANKEHITQHIRMQNPAFQPARKSAKLAKFQKPKP